MMTQQLQASILTAPLAQIDRRSLSQAWYSALHLSRARITPVLESPSGTTAEPVPICASVVSDGRRSERFARRDGAPAPAAKQTASQLEPLAQQRLRRSLALQIERVVRNARKPLVRSTLTLGRGEGRVHIVLQSDGGRTRMFAVCRPVDRQRVARALEEVRYALAAAGCVLESRMRAASCS